MQPVYSFSPKFFKAKMGILQPTTKITAKPRIQSGILKTHANGRPSEQSLFPKGISQLNLDTRIDARIAVAQRSRGNMHSVYSHIDRPLGACKVVESNPSLR